MNTSIDKVSLPQTRRFERGNKQLLLALASVSMLGFAGNVSAATFTITPPSSVLTTDTQAIFKVSITAGAAISYVVCDTYVGGSAIASSARAESSGIIVSGGGITYSAGASAFYRTDLTFSILCYYLISDSIGSG